MRKLERWRFEGKGGSSAFQDDAAAAMGGKTDTECSYCSLRKQGGYIHAQRPRCNRLFSLLAMAGQITVEEAR
jgi:hypothetical protein